MNETAARPSAHPVVAWLVSIPTAIALGLAWAVAEPRGPVTGVQAVALMGTAAATGWLGGRLTGSRAAAPLLALGAIVGFEVGRAGGTLPTVAGPDVTSGFGILALLLGRIVPWLLAAVPLAVGAGWGRRHRTGGRRLALVLATLTLILFAGWVLVPPVAAPVRADGGFADLIQVDLGGHRQWVQIRGTDRDNPVLLYLSGGPGQSDLAFSRVLLEPLLEDVTIVGWDQRGTGKSYPDLDEENLTLDGAVSDVVELAGWLRDRFGQERIYLLGESWGSLLGVLAVQRAPELFAAYIGSGQMVDPHETDTGIYRDLITAAMGSGDGELVAELVAIGPPPYPSVFDYGRIMSLYPLLEGDYTPPREYRELGAKGNVGPMGLFGSEYAPMDKLNVLRGLMDMFPVLYPQLQEVDLRRSASSLQVPVHILCGDHELDARTGPARQWYDSLRAPAKRWHQLPDAGHSVAFEQSGMLHRILTSEA